MQFDIQYRYPVMETFYSIQGEGYNTGKPAFFIRLGGCDVGCVWCDVKESWDAEKHPLYTVDELVTRVKETDACRVVITGGEPAMYELSHLTNALHAAGIECYLETSGAYPISGSWDWICISPKKFKAPLMESLEKADELKVVIYNKTDFDWGEKHAMGVTADCKLFLQPEFSAFNKMTPLIVDYVKQHPEWTISLQTHKIMEIP